MKPKRTRNLHLYKQQQVQDFSAPPHTYGQLYCPLVYNTAVGHPTLLCPKELREMGH